MTPRGFAALFKPRELFHGSFFVTMCDQPNVPGDTEMKRMLEEIRGLVDGIRLALLEVGGFPSDALVQVALANQKMKAAKQDHDTTKLAMAILDYACSADVDSLRPMQKLIADAMDHGLSAPFHGQVTRESFDRIHRSIETMAQRWGGQGVITEPLPEVAFHKRTFQQFELGGAALVTQSLEMYLEMNKDKDKDKDKDLYEELALPAIRAGSTPQHLELIRRVLEVHVHFRNFRASDCKPP